MRGVFETIAKNGHFNPLVPDHWYDYTPADIANLVSEYLLSSFLIFCTLFYFFLLPFNILFYFNFKYVGWRASNTCLQREHIQSTVEFVS